MDDNIDVLLKKSNSAKDIKIYTIPYFLRIYEALFDELDKVKKHKRGIKVKKINNAAILVPLTPRITGEIGQDSSEYEEADLKSMIDFVYHLLVDLNMYSNPEFLDSLYHYTRMIGINLFENAKKETPDDSDEYVHKSPIGNKAYLDVYKIGVDKGTNQDVYETQFRSEAYGINTNKRTENLFNYVFNSRHPFRQKHVPLPAIQQKMGFEPDPVNTNIWLAKMDGNQASVAGPLDGGILAAIDNIDFTNNDAKPIIKQILELLNPTYLKRELEPVPKTQDELIEGLIGIISKTEITESDDISVLTGSISDSIDTDVPMWKENSDTENLINISNILSIPDIHLHHDTENLTKNSEILNIDDIQLTDSEASTSSLTYSEASKLKNNIISTLKGFKLQSGGDPLDKKYRYLEDSILSRYFEDAVEESAHTCKIHICVFSIDNSCQLETSEDPIPFLKFLVKPETRGFVSFQYDVPAQDSTEDFKCNLYERVLSEFDLSVPGTEPSCESMSKTLDWIYRGLISEKINGEIHVFAFFDYDSMSTALIPGPDFPKNINDDSLSTSWKWAIVDELLFERNLYGDLPVDPIIPSFFVKHPLVWNIYDEDGKWFDFPFALYCATIKETESSEEFENIRVPVDKESSKMREDAPLLKPPEIDNYGLEDEYGQRFCFTYKPLHSEEPTLVKRYAVFTTDPVYLAGDSKELETETDSEDASTEDVSTEDVDREMINKLETPVIYFVANNEYTKHKPTVMWGIKDANRFVAL